MAGLYYSAPIKVRYYGQAGPSIIVLHGGPGAPGSAEGLARALADHFMVSEPLQRVSGEVPLNVDVHVKDLLQVSRGGEILAGHSWGAMLGLSFASLYPEMVSRLILIGCGTYSQETRLIMRKRLNEMMDGKIRKKINDLQKRYMSSQSKDEKDSIYERLGQIFMDIECYEALQEYSENREPGRIDSAGHEETWNDVLRLQQEGIEPERFKNIKCPVLMIHGDFDPHPGRETAELLLRYIPHLEYREIKRCGHEPWREKYGRAPMLDHIRGWISAGC